MEKYVHGSCQLLCCRAALVNSRDGRTRRKSTPFPQRMTTSCLCSRLLSSTVSRPCRRAYATSRDLFGSMFHNVTSLVLWYNVLIDSLSMLLAPHTYSGDQMEVINVSMRQGFTKNLSGSSGYLFTSEARLIPASQTRL